MSNIPEIFGCKVFNDSTMRARLPKDIYRQLRKTREETAPPTLPTGSSR